MNIEEIRNYCMQKNGAEESMPFGDDVVVFKVGGKVYLLLPLSSSPVQFNVKCNPELAVELRERYNCVLPGYHMNKKHWNTILVDGSVSKKLIVEWIDHSYKLIVQSLPKAAQKVLNDLS